MKLKPWLLLSPVLFTACLHEKCQHDTPTESVKVSCVDVDGDGLGFPTACAEGDVDTCPNVFDRNNDPASCADDPLPVVDSDGDGVADGSDLCSGTVANAAVDTSGCADVQVDTDDDGICNPGAVSNGPAACKGSDNCPSDANKGQGDENDDGYGDACQTKEVVFALLRCAAATTDGGNTEIRIECNAIITNQDGSQIPGAIDNWTWDLFEMGLPTGLTVRTQQQANFFPAASLACTDGDGDVFSVQLTMDFDAPTSEIFYISNSGDDSLVQVYTGIKIPDGLC